MNILPALSRLTLTTDALGDEGEPILLDEEGGGGSSSGGAGPSSAAGPSAAADDDVELVDEATFRIAPCVAPGLRLGTTVLAGKRMNALFAARRFDKCACLGVYTGTPMLGSEFNRTKKIAKEYEKSNFMRPFVASVRLN